MKYLFLTLIFSNALAANVPKNPTIPLIDFIRYTAGQDLRCAQDSDCLWLPVGQNTCGGPRDYVMASTRHKGFENLQSLAETSQEVEKEYNDEYGIVSPCEAVRSAPIACMKNECTIKEQQ